MSPAFRQFLQARFLLTLATQMQAVLLGWRMYDLTHRALYLGAIGLAEALPALGLALWAGYLVDRREPLRMLRQVVWLSLLSALLLVAGPLLLGAGAQVALLYVCSVLTGTARAFAQPAIAATLPRLCSRQALPRALAQSATALQVARVAGPAVGGLLAGTCGVIWTGAAICLLLAATVVLLGAMPAPPQAARAAALPPPFSWQSLLAGARVVFGHPVLLPALSLDMLSVMFGGVTALLPIFAAEILHTGAWGLGALRAAPALGAALGSALLVRRTPGAAAGRSLLAAVAGFGVAVVLFGLSTSLPLSLAALVISGACDSVSVVIRSAAVQLMSPPALLGRIAAVNALFIGSSNELGEFESGLAAAAWGAVAAVVGGGLICLGVVALIGSRCPALRRLDLQVTATIV